MTIELNGGIERAFRLSDAKTQQGTVEQALENFVKTLQRKQRFSLRESGTWEGDLDQMRTE